MTLKEKYGQSWLTKRHEVGGSRRENPYGFLGLQDFPGSVGALANTFKKWTVYLLQNRTILFALNIWDGMMQGNRIKLVAIR
jgi:hypothetical protein